MKSLRILLKIAERDLETLRRALAEQISRQGLIEERIRSHDQMLGNEQRQAVKDYESQRAYGGFAALALQRRRALLAEHAMVSDEMERIRALVTAAHVEARKFERLIELDEARAKAAADKRENAELDEFATLQAGRRTSGL